MFSAPRPRLSKHLVYQINLQHFSQAPIFMTLGQSANESRQSLDCPIMICRHDSVEKVFHVLCLWCETLQSDSSKIRPDIIWVTSQTLFNILECSKFFLSLNREQRAMSEGLITSHRLFSYVVFV